MSSLHEKSRATSLILWGSVLIALVLVVFALRFLTRERVSVRTARVTYKDLVKPSPASGRVEPIEDYAPHAQIAGVVQDIYVHVGEKVKPGQLLLKMEDADARASLARAQSSLQAAELAASDIAHGGSQDERNTYAANLTGAAAQVQQDEAVLSARQQLQQKGAASPAEVADARQHLDADQNNLHSIQQHSTQRYGDADRAEVQARIAEAKAAVVAAQSALASSNIRAPFAGTVYSIPVSQYDYVPAGDDLIYVADLNRIQVTGYFDEPEVGNLAVGQPVKIEWDAKPGMVWHGHVSIAPTTIITYATRNVGECFITVDDADGVLLPNTNVTVTVTTAQRLHVLSVPREALHTDGGNYVYLVLRNKLVRTPVQIGLFNLTWVEIDHGLAEGDTIATSATTNRDLTNGLEITPVE
jgi:HlyD family secretion protein